jgi:uncharacterized protein
LISSSLWAQEALYPNEFPLGDVKLLDGPFKHAQQLNIQTLLQYDVNRLLAGFRKEAGLPEKAKTFPNWDGLEGHVGGHYLSAMAMNYAATGNKECKKRMIYMLKELKACQEANAKNYPDWGKGYIGAVPNSEKIWPALAEGDFGAYRSAWVPFYNLHKLYAGLRDAWLYTGNNEAKTLFLTYTDWLLNITKNLSDEQIQSILDTEPGGINETLADAYQITGNQKYLDAAKRFSHHILLDAMAASVDNLDNKHANTQVPKVVGFERIAELAHDDAYAHAGEFFWQTVTQARSLAFGGNSRREFFPSVKSSPDFINDVEGPETCNSYNMLKLTEDLFRVNPKAAYADYYERTMYNHILSTQHPVHGGYVYFTPARPQHYRVYSEPNQGMWCCVGSGMENHGKYGQFIYTHTSDSLYINLFVASELNWKERKISITQQTKFPYKEETEIVINKAKSDFTLMIRYPSWVANGALEVYVNGEKEMIINSPSSYVAIHKVWKKGDVVKVKLPMQNRLEQLPHMPDYVAVMHGPVLLAAKTGTEDMSGLIADDGRWAHIAHGKKMPLDKAPIIIAKDQTEIAQKIKLEEGNSLLFNTSDLKIINAENLSLQPFFDLHDSRYMMYWMALSPQRYTGYLGSLAAAEKEILALEKRTIDFVAPGEQQPEADHYMESNNSNTGNNQDEFFRDARGEEGFFSYKLNTKGETKLSILVKYWGAEWGTRKFDIFINNQKLVTEDNTGKWNLSAFQNIVYDIPEQMLKGKSSIRVKFQALKGSTAGGVYYLRLLKDQ